MTGGIGVTTGRIVAEHRLAIGVLAVVLALNVAALVAGVLPLARVLDATERRAAAAADELAAAEADLVAAEAMRTGKDKAVEDLQTFYTEVLPADAAEARGLLHTSLAQLAAAEGVSYLRLSANTERLRDSLLERMRAQMTLSGSYADIRRFIHAIETREGFVIIENVMLGEGAEAGSSDLALTLDLSTYYRVGGVDGR